MKKKIDKKDEEKLSSLSNVLLKSVKEQELTLIKIANETELHKNSISNVLNGNSNVSIITLNKICKTLGFTIYLKNEKNENCFEF